jgi:hypothetical protein
LHRWHYVVIKPGGEPVRELFDAIATVTPKAAGEDPAVALKQYLDRSDNRYLPVIDQFEEVFAFTDITRARSVLPDPPGNCHEMEKQNCPHHRDAQRPAQ